VTDGTNTSVSDTAVVTVNNVAPTATFSNNGPVDTGATVTLSFTSPSDPSSADTAAGFKYSYDFNNDGTWDVVDSTSPTATTSFAAAGTYTVKGRIKDKDGGFTTYTTTVTVNALPTANAGPDQTANEGSSVSFTGTAGGGTGTLSYDWDFGDGSTHGTGTLTPTHKYADNGTYTVTLKVTDGTNTSVSDTAVVTVNNVAPTATFSNNGPVTAGSTVTLTFSNPSDPSSADTAAGFKYSYDFNNDGTWDVVDSTSATAATSFATAGTYTVDGRIKDKDGGFTTYSTSVTVNNPTTGHTYYVATTGSDSAAGTSAAPWKTLQKAADTVQAGDTVVVHAGTYAGFRRFAVAGGTASSPITFSADPGVIINSFGPGESNAYINIENTSPADGYYIIEGFTVANPSNRGIRSAMSRHNTFLNDTVYGAGDSDIFASRSDFITVQGNTCYNAAGQHGIYVNGSDSYVIRGNTCYGNNWDGIHTNVSDGVNQVNSHGLIENNVVHDNLLAGMDLTGMNTTTVRNNVIYGNGRHGIVLQNSNSNATTACHDNIIVNNTIDARAGSSAYAIEIAGLSTQPAGSTWTSNDQNTIVTNNILMANTTSGYGSIGDLGTVSATFTSDYNIVVDGFHAGSSTLTLASWRTATGQDAHSIISTATALFVNAAGGDYRLKSGSPAIDKGTTTNAPPTDIAGTARPLGAGIDIGAYESF
jgi:parallel beta-helix repeat protein